MLFSTKIRKSLKLSPTRRRSAHAPVGVRAISAAIRRAAAALLLAASIAAAPGCADAPATDAPNSATPATASDAPATAAASENAPDDAAILSIRGNVLEVQPYGIIAIETLRIIDESGAEWLFDGRRKVIPDFTPSHLNDHKLLGESVQVMYYRDGNALVIHSIAD